MMFRHFLFDGSNFRGRADQALDTSYKASQLGNSSALASPLHPRHSTAHGYSSSRLSIRSGRQRA
jgi:hypothetical protein